MMEQKRNPYTVGLATLGCKVAQYETEALAERFEALGFCVLPFDEICDVYVVNTCTVTAESDRKSRQCVRRAARKNAQALIMVTGCYAQTSPEEAAALPNVVYVTGNGQKMQIPSCALALLQKKGQQTIIDKSTPLEHATFEPMCIQRAPRTRAYVKIEDGCECRCAYCTIPLARGPVRSKKADDVLREVEGLVRGGTEEIVLTGIETASYGKDLHDGTSLVTLIEQIAGATDVSRIRLGSMMPDFFTEERIERLAAVGPLTPHFHLSVQSGSSAVLARMRRRYNAERAMQAIHTLRKHFNALELSADFICGFPGETEEEFSETLAFAREAAFLQMHVFTYSRRKNTLAAKLEDQIPSSIASERSKRLMALGEQMRLARLQGALTYPSLSVLFEQREGDCFLGHTEHFIPVAVKTGLDLHGKLVSVLPHSTDGRTVTAALPQS